MAKQNPATPKATALLVIYGEGGHKAEMQRLLDQLIAAAGPINIISMGPTPLNHAVLAHFQAADIRDKHSRLLSLLLLIPMLLKTAFTMVQILRSHQLIGVISTGPGLCILPMILCRLLGIKTLFVETFCRFYSRSLTGRVMSKIAQRFLVQNESLLLLYPNAEYCGRI